MVARDAAGNVSTPSAEASATVADTPSPGLVAAYGFAEGSGTITADSTGNGNTGSLTDAAWTTAGKLGSALSFNGPRRASRSPTAPRCGWPAG